MKFFGAVVCAVALLFSPGLAKDEMPVAELVKKHLDSIGTEQARATVKTRVVQGAVRFRVLSGGVSEHMQSAATPEGKEEMGKGVFVSEGGKFVSLLKLPNPSYHGERFVTDGTTNLVAEMRPGTYSDFGEFVHVHDEILTEGLWGGVLSTGWALAHLEDRHATLKYKGLKKFGDRELHCVEYLPAKHSDLQVELYFDPETYRHILTSYSLTISPQMAGIDQLSARQQPTRYVIEEQFVGFKPIDGLELPERWIVRFTENIARNLNVPAPSALCGSGQKGHGICPSVVYGRGGPDLKPFAIEFDAIGTSISHNVSIDPKNFEIK